MRQRSVLKLLTIMFLILGIGFFAVCAQSDAQEKVETVKTAISADGIAINYYEHGQEGPVLVFVHGWSCDASYWREQIGYFKGEDRSPLSGILPRGRGDRESRRLVDGTTARREP